MNTGDDSRIQLSRDLMRHLYSKDVYTKWIELAFPTPAAFLGNASLAMPAVIATVVWKGFPFFGIAYLAGLQAIPSEQYEAAQVDGADPFQRFRYITLPGLKYVILITVMLSLIWTSNTFDLVYLMTNGGPSNATQVFTLLTYTVGIANGRIGDASTIPMMAMPLFAGLIVILTRVMMERETEEA